MNKQTSKLPAELKACPFCGGSDATVNKEEHNRWYVNCVHCSASTAYYKTKAEAIKAWNTRTPLESKSNSLNEAYMKLSGIKPVATALESADDEIKRLKEEMDKANEIETDLNNTISFMEQGIKDWKAKCDKYKDALKKYGRHRGSCETNFIDRNSNTFYKKCTCGLTKALSKGE